MTTVETTTQRVERTAREMWTRLAAVPNLDPKEICLVSFTTGYKQCLTDIAERSKSISEKNPPPEDSL